MFNNMTKSLLGLGLTLAVFGTAQAYPVAVQLDITGDSSSGYTTNVPGFSLSNLSTFTLDIVGFNFTIGNTAFNFDDTNSNYPTSGNYLVTHNTTGSVKSSDDHYRADSINLLFTGFNRGELYNFSPDVDLDSSDFTTDFRTVFFNNGAVANSVITVIFANGGVLSLTLPEAPIPVSGSLYRFTLTGEVPVPGTLLLLAAGMIGFRTRLLKA